MGKHLVTVYEKNDCVGCNATSRWLDKQNIPEELVERISLDTDADAVAKVKALGFMGAPVVVGHASGTTWSGYSPDRLAENLAAFQESQELAVA